MNNTVSPEQPRYTIPFATLTTLFFMWGFITCMNDVLIPHLKELFNLSYLQSMLVQFCFFGAYFTGSVIYFITSYLWGDPINKIGYKNGMLLGLLTAAIGCFLFYPAAVFSVYGLFLSALFILGLGFTLLQIAANPYVSLLGKPEGASSRLNLAQAFNSLGTTIAPIIGGFLIFEFFAVNGEITAAATEIPYIIFTGVFLLLAILLYKIKLPEFKTEESLPEGLGALQFSHLKLGILGIFFYVGAEVCIGSFVINFLALPEIMGIPESVSKNYLALYWGGAMIGRFIGAISLSQGLSGSKKISYMVIAALLVFGVIFAIVDLSFSQISTFLIFMIINLIGFFIGKSAPAKTLALFALVNVVLVFITIFTNGSIAMWTVLSAGLFNSIMWSNIFTLSIHGLGKYTSQGSSLLVMAILGGAILPLVQGALADSLGLQYSFIVPVFCYLYIAFFGFYCSRKLGDVKVESISGGH
ncbi:sugar MFS transporter [Pedobacter cryophilus]|uniref:Sugar MFS transporter n=1 Tax=Pedobacter cryophilus TaxID=2571271 RepID=A0A4U1BUK9_9SPHI|nr:sugar MFS transporter [Pedobacter cryophilus]TKB96372.1 sugar MFS transporter [Pedobacter cryophilus]